MQEYWINVYEWGPVLNPHRSRERAIKAKLPKDKVAYRIHVKLKPLYIQHYGQHYGRINRNKYLTPIFK